MWIKSQDGMILTDTKFIYAEENEFRAWQFDIMGYTGREKIYLGDYSKKAAKEVLNQIEERLNEGCNFVYQMPTAEAVEEILEGMKAIEDMDSEFSEEISKDFVGECIENNLREDK